LHRRANKLQRAEGDDVRGISYVSGTTQTLRAHFQNSADRLVEHLGLKSGDLVVDIGSNDGNLARVL